MNTIQNSFNVEREIAAFADPRHSLLLSILLSTLNNHKQEIIFCLFYQIVINLLLLVLYPMRK